MSSTPSEPNAGRSGPIQSWLARLRGEEPPPPAAAEEELLPTWDAPGAANLVPASEAPTVPPTAQPALPMTQELQAVVLCPVCEAPRRGSQSSCDDCGYIFPPVTISRARPALASAAPAAPGARLKGRYELGQPLAERLGVARFRGLDHGAGDGGGPVPVVLVRAPVPEDETKTPPTGLPTGDDDEVLPGFDDGLPASLEKTQPLPPLPSWPSVSWEHALLSNVPADSGLPAFLDRFDEGGFEYLVEEVPQGRALWDAWEDPDATADQRYGWLQQVAEALQALHNAGAILEALRPDIVAVSADGRARLTDLSDLLPLPLPPDPPIRATLYTAPELVVASHSAGARADLYGFGAMLYALHVGRELTEMDFEGQGSPKPFIPRFPDIHPAFGRLMTKTFAKDVNHRFPSDEAVKEDATGFSELIRTLQSLRRTMDNVRLEIASWTTTGMVRTGNEDAFALLHAAESRQDDLGDSALVLLADGMGGYEAGEVAAALAIAALRKNLLQHKPFDRLAGASAFPSDVPRPEGNAPAPLDVEACKKLLLAALKDANKQVFTASRGGVGRRGMGCTAEAVYVDGRNLVVGHVGDSRTYHLREGRLVQVTRDQTLVSRLVELGTLTPEEAETHPRRNELQQAVGGQPDVEPGIYHSILKPGDWVVVCSDGLSNHVSSKELQEMLQVEGFSAETAARRLVNLVNLKGATDNATVVVIRMT